TNSQCCPERTQKNQDGVAFLNSKIRLTDIRDGTSNTFLFMEENHLANRSWIAPGDGSNEFLWVHHPSQGYVCCDNPPSLPNSNAFNHRAPHGAHGGGGSAPQFTTPSGSNINVPAGGGAAGVLAAMADGSVTWVSNGIDFNVFRALFTRAGGEP